MVQEWGHGPAYLQCVLVRDSNTYYCRIRVNNCVQELRSDQREAVY